MKFHGSFERSLRLLGYWASVGRVCTLGTRRKKRHLSFKSFVRAMIRSPPSQEKGAAPTAAHVRPVQSVLGWLLGISGGEGSQGACRFAHNPRQDRPAWAYSTVSSDRETGYYLSSRPQQPGRPQENVSAIGFSMKYTFGEVHERPARTQTSGNFT